MLLPRSPFSQTALRLIGWNGAKIQLTGPSTSRRMAFTVTSPTTKSSIARPDIGVLEDNLKPPLEFLKKEGQKIIFQQNGVPCHTANRGKNNEDKELELLPWPAQSPDLNPLNTNELRSTRSSLRWPSLRRPSKCTGTRLPARKCSTWLITA